MSKPWFKCPVTAWPEVAAALRGEEWPEPIAAADLAWWSDQLKVGKVKRYPSSRALVDRWGWSRHHVRALLREVNPEGFTHSPPTSHPLVTHSAPNTEAEVPEKTEADNPLPTHSPPTPHPLSATRAEVQSTEHRAQSQNNTPLPPKGESMDALPKWVPSRLPKHAPARSEVFRIVVACIEAVRLKPVANVLKAGTAAGPILALWRKLDWCEDFEADFGLVAAAAHRCPAPLFARGIRAEGWADGTARQSHVSTIAVQTKWDDRLMEAQTWDEQGRPLTVARPEKRDIPAERQQDAGTDEAERVEAWKLARQLYESGAAFCVDPGPLESFGRADNVIRLERG